MLAGRVDYKNSLSKKIRNQEKIDPGTFSFLQPGWWAFHAAAIGAIWVTASRMSKHRPSNM